MHWGSIPLFFIFDNRITSYIVDWLMRIHNILLLSSFLFIFYSGYSQDGALQIYQNGFYVKQYSEMAGLVHNGCRSVFEDSRGFLWITTFNGLSRFDGKHFTNYGVKDGLPGSNITQVSEDSLGYICSHS